LQWATPAVAIDPADENGSAHLGLSARSTKTGELPILHWRPAHRPNPADGRRVAGEGGVRELALEVRVPIWGTGGDGAHHGGLVVVKQIGGGEPTTVGRRRARGRRLRVRGAVVSSGGSHCGDGGACRWPELALNGKAASASEGGGRLVASTVPCGR
jgi:hypothetical protein